MVIACNWEKRLIAFHCSLFHEKVRNAPFSNPKHFENQWVSTSRWIQSFSFTGVSLYLQFWKERNQTSLFKFSQVFYSSFHALPCLWGNSNHNYSNHNFLCSNFLPSNDEQTSFKTSFKKYISNYKNVPGASLSLKLCFLECSLPQGVC